MDTVGEGCPRQWGRGWPCSLYLPPLVFSLAHSSMTPEEINYEQAWSQVPCPVFAPSRPSTHAGKGCLVGRRCLVPFSFENVPQLSSLQSLLPSWPWPEGTQGAESCQEMKRGKHTGGKQYPPKKNHESGEPRKSDCCIPFYIRPLHRH